MKIKLTLTIDDRQLKDSRILENSYLELSTIPEYVIVDNITQMVQQSLTVASNKIVEKLKNSEPVNILIEMTKK